MKILNRNQFVLCRGKKCCPVVTFDGDDVFIKDDYKQEIKMTREQFMEIGNVVNSGAIPPIEDK